MPVRFRPSVPLIRSNKSHNILHRSHCGDFTGFSCPIKYHFISSDTVLFTVSYITCFLDTVK
ncbi:hypothetical protein BMETH_489_1 [methanotrophic bacterial endosymbiont of Bathymodiolus sp.]|nr:hypothetical protein BMETH_489_1 [methanotrophic bacterial endosymbiont of Bathymodiolus sp.]